MGADCYRIYIICPCSTGFVHSLIIVTLLVLNIDIVIRDRCQNGVARHCNSLLSEMPQQLIEKLQMVQNCSTRTHARTHTHTIFKTSKCTHASPLLTTLHWLPIAQRIKYKVSSDMCYGVASETVSEAVLKIQFIVLLLCYTTNTLIIRPLSSLLK